MTKIVLIGDSGVGKTCLVNTLVNDEFIEEHQATIGASYSIKDIHYNKQVFRLHIWDTAGQERYQSMTPIYFHNAAIALLVFALNDLSSFDSIGRWAQTVTDFPDADITIILLGNKCDLDSERLIPIDQCISKAQSLGCKYIEVSAKSGFGLDELESEIGAFLAEKYKQSVQTETISLQQIPPEKKCCN